MPNSAAFLNDEEKREYEELGGGVQRLIVEIPISPAAVEARPAGRPEPRPLAPFVAEQVRKLIDKHEREGSASIRSKWFGCACVEVRDEDGMTWSAETVSLKLEDDFPRFNRIHLASYKDNYSLPVISNLIGVRRFLKAAEEHRLLSPSALSGRWPAPVIFGVAVLLGVVLQLIPEPAEGGPSTRTTYLTILASAVIGLASQYVITHLTDRTIPKKIEKLNSELEKIAAGGGDEKYHRFIDSLARCLKGVGFPRFVIVDDYERLDLPTRGVIQRYFEQYAPDAAGSEYWVVFEGQDGDKFSSQIDDGQKFEAYRESIMLRQLFLDKEERRRLVEQLGRAPEAVHYQAVKLICKDTAKGKERVRKIVERYRRDHPKEPIYGDLELLYLLSLATAFPGNFSLSDPDLSNRLADKNLVRSDVLRQFLHGTNLGLNELRDRLKSVPESFPTLLAAEETKREKKLHIVPETTLALAGTAKALALPRPGLGHLFWSLYWYNVRQQLPWEAFWVRKLNYHLKEAELFTPAGGEADKRTLNELFDALIYAVDGSLRTGVFEDVTPLLEKAPHILEMGGLTDSRPHQNRLATRCWEAYSVLGRDEILGVVFDLSALPGRQEPAAGAGAERQDLLEALFFDSMPLAPPRRAALMTDFFRRMGGDRQTVESVSDYARVRSAWLALSASPIAGVDVTKLHRAVRRSDGTLEELTRKALNRIGSKSEESARITDIATLSLALWCNALRFHHSTAYITQPDHAANFKTLVGLATDAVLKASYIREEATIRSENFLRMDFLASGLAGELCAVALASIVMANQYLVRQGREVIDQPLLDQIKELFNFSAEISNLPLPTDLTPQKLTSSVLIKKIDAMLGFCSIVWDRFGLQRLLDFTNIRRVHFNAVCGEGKHASERSFDSLLESVGSAINDRGFTGLIANLVVADCLRQAGEIEAYYLRQAGLIALEGDFGPRLKQELSFAVIDEIHNLGYDLDEFLESVLEENGRNECFLLSLLDRLPEGYAGGRVLALTNAPSPSTPPEVVAKLEATIASYVERIRRPDEKREVDGLLRYFSLAEKVRRKEAADSSEILDSWKGLKDLPIYADVLDLIIANGSAPPEVFSESLSALDHDPLQDSYTSHLFLAMRRALHFLKSGEADEDARAILVRYLRTGVERWKSELTAEVNVEIYRLLMSLDPEKKLYYFSEVQNWQYVALRRTQLERLPQLVAAGKFFLIFFDYTQTMLPWGLASDMEAKEFHARLAAPPEQKKERLIVWKNGGGEVPEPLGGGDSVSGEFICLGHCLFNAPDDQGANFHDDREAFNRAAYRAISDLLDLITDLPALPNSIKELLQNYSKRLIYEPAESAKN